MGLMMYGLSDIQSQQKQEVLLLNRSKRRILQHKPTQQNTFARSNQPSNKPCKHIHKKMPIQLIQLVLHPNTTSRKTNIYGSESSWTTIQISRNSTPEPVSPQNHQWSKGWWKTLNLKILSIQINHRKYRGKHTYRASQLPHFMKCETRGENCVQSSKVE